MNKDLELILEVKDGEEWCSLLWNAHKKMINKKPNSVIEFTKLYTMAMRSEHYRPNTLYNNYNTKGVWGDIKLLYDYGTYIKTQLEPVDPNAETQRLVKYDKYEDN